MKLIFGPSGAECIVQNHNIIIQSFVLNLHLYSIVSPSIYHDNKM